MIEYRPKQKRIKLNNAPYKRRITKRQDKTNGTDRQDKNSITKRQSRKRTTVHKRKPKFDHGDTRAKKRKLDISAKQSTNNLQHRYTFRERKPQTKKLVTKPQTITKTETMFSRVTRARAKLHGGEVDSEVQDSTPKHRRTNDLQTQNESSNEHLGTQKYKQSKKHITTVIAMEKVRRDENLRSAEREERRKNREEIRECLRISSMQTSGLRNSSFPRTLATQQQEQQQEQEQEQEQQEQQQEEEQQERPGLRKSPNRGRPVRVWHSGYSKRAFSRNYRIPPPTFRKGPPKKTLPQPQPKPHPTNAKIRIPEKEMGKTVLATDIPPRASKIRAWELLDVLLRAEHEEDTGDLQTLPRTKVRKTN